MSDQPREEMVMAGGTLRAVQILGDVELNQYDMPGHVFGVVLNFALSPELELDAVIMESLAKLMDQFVNDLDAIMIKEMEVQGIELEPPQELNS